MGKGSRAGGQFAPTQRADIPAAASSMRFGDIPSDPLTDAEEADLCTHMLRVVEDQKCPLPEVVARTAERVGDHTGGGFIAACWDIYPDSRQGLTLIDEPDGGAAADKIRTAMERLRANSSAIQGAVIERSADGLVEAARHGKLSQDMANVAIHQAARKFVCENDHVLEMCESISSGDSLVTAGFSHVPGGDPVMEGILARHETARRRANPVH